MDNGQSVKTRKGVELGEMFFGNDRDTEIAPRRHYRVSTFKVFSMALFGLGHQIHSGLNLVDFCDAAHRRRRCSSLLPVRLLAATAVAAALCHCCFNLLN